jgi:large subunit ribosomal protein L4
MKVKVFNKEGKETGREIELSDAIFGLEPNEHAVYLAVKSQLAAQRQGTHKTKERNEIARTTKKAFRQKGTGGARRGDMKSPLVRGGGRVFGPKPHAYDLKINKKVKDVARKSALSGKLKAESLLVIEDFGKSAPRTKEFAQVLKNFNLSGQRSVVVMDQPEKNTILSARNIPQLTMVSASQLSVLDIMNCRKILLSEGAVQAIHQNLSNQ